jgi:hypothetical protein
MRRPLIIGAAVAIVGFTVASLFVYEFHPTAGTVILGLGWLSILCTGYLLVRTVQTFDVRVGGPVGGDLTTPRRTELEREKRLLVKAIKEVEFDRESGKLDGGEAAEAIARYRTRAVEILRLLDEGKERHYESLIEKELADRLKASAPDPRACPACQATNDEDAAFCKKCGVKLERA